MLLTPGIPGLRRALPALAVLLCMGMGGPAGRLPPLATWAVTTDAAADLLVLDPEAGPPPAKRGAQVRLARLSLGVSEPTRPYHRMAAMLPTASAGAAPGVPGGVRMDPRSGAWRGVLLGEVVPRYAKAGWDGLYLTDLDVGPTLEASGRHEAATAAMAELVTDIRGLEPDLRLVAEGGLPFLEALGKALDGIAARDVFGAGDAAARREALVAARKATGLPVLVLERSAAAAAQAKAAGFVPAVGGL